MPISKTEAKKLGYQYILNNPYHNHYDRKVHFSWLIMIITMFIVGMAYPSATKPALILISIFAISEFLIVIIDFYTAERLK